MYLKRHGDFAKLQECVSGTGLTGEGLFLPDGCCQFVADDGGNVIWDPYEPSIRFLGEGSAAEELEREVKAVANGRFEAITKKTKKSRGNMDIRKSRNSRALRQLSDQLDELNDHLYEETSVIATELEELKECMDYLVHHLGMSDWSQVRDAKKKKRRIATLQQCLETPQQDEHDDVDGAGLEGCRKLKSVTDVDVA
jgi:hypothetical protein